MKSGPPDWVASCPGGPSRGCVGYRAEGTALKLAPHTGTLEAGESQGELSPSKAGKAPFLSCSSWFSFWTQLEGGGVLNAVTWGCTPGQEPGPQW